MTTDARLAQLMEYLRINNLSPFQAAMRFADELQAMKQIIKSFEVENAAERLKRCEEALRFYADPENYNKAPYLGLDVGCVPAEAGELARFYFQSIQEASDDR